MQPKERTIGVMFGSGEANTFLGLPACPDLEKLEADVALLGAPCATPYPSVGPYCAGAPKAIRAAMALAGLFAIFHRHAHGTEMPQTISGYEYAAGFMVATALLHGIGIAVGLTAGRLAERGGKLITQTTGAVIAFAGIVLLASAL